jgi:hypothetical protein
MKNTYYQHAILLWHVVNNVGLMLNAPEIRREIVGALAEQWVVRKKLKAGLQSIMISLGLLYAKGLNCVIRNPGKIGIGL